ncbi:MAG: DUF3306 domain-containing protein [Yoonia sp.]|uniref:DUF3306 domain-containing protein n=1 Tax=Yoonia sp. TaxID=2212373 RepID=UPI003EF673E9
MSTLGSSWSRRRAAVAEEAAAEERAQQEAQLKAEQAALAEKTDEEILEELGLPDPDQLEMGDDFKAFMSKAVPNHLRKRALRKLWRSNPVLACVDGLNDYDDDYLTGSYGQDPIKTGYQVGKGMLAHILEVERQQAATAAGHAVVSDDDDNVEVIPDDDLDNDAPSGDTVLVAASDDTPSATDADDAVQAPAPRRMQFQFEDKSA